MKRTYKILIFILTTLFVMDANAQIGVYGSGYFQNQYIFNPAMAGLNDHEFNINLAYLRQDNSGADNSAFKTLGGTADYGFNDAIGAGISIYNDKAGAITSSRYVGTYAYHLKLNDQNQRLHLGFSVVGLQQGIRLDGVSADPALYNFNKRKMEIEGDFGAAYTDENWNIQAAAPNLVSLIKNRARDEIFSQSTLFASASYRFKLAEEGDDQITVEPKVAYRGYKTTKNILDAGANLTIMNNMFNFYGMYHSAKNVTAGVGFKLDFAQIMGSYTTAPSALSGYSLGSQFEVAIKFNISNKN